MDYDVFNGDADGILSLVQLRLSEPRPNAMLVTGPKRDILLLERVDARAGDRLTVLDVSMRTNREHLVRVLEAGASVFYADHHNPGEAVTHPNLTAHIDTSPETCTAAIVDGVLGGAHRAWAVTAAFGDNFPVLARRLAQGRDLPLAELERLGTLINYNSYGASLEDLYYHPDALFKQLVPFATPMAFLDASPEIAETLEAGFQTDLAGAVNAEVLHSDDDTHLVLLPDAPGSRRISGVFGNLLAQDHPDRAHAVATKRGDVYVISIRAPLSRRTGADKLALQFPTGGGRAAAAGINALPASALEKFTAAFRSAFAS